MKVKSKIFQLFILPIGAFCLGLTFSSECLSTKTPSATPVKPAPGEPPILRGEKSRPKRKVIKGHVDSAGATKPMPYSGPPGKPGPRGHDGGGRKSYSGGSKDEHTRAHHYGRAKSLSGDVARDSYKTAQKNYDTARSSGSSSSLASIASLLSQASKQLPGEKGASSPARKNIAQQAEAIPLKDIGDPLVDAMNYSDYHDEMKKHEDASRAAAKAMDQNANDLAKQEKRYGRLGAEDSVSTPVAAKGLSNYKAPIAESKPNTNDQTLASGKNPLMLVKNSNQDKGSDGSDDSGITAGRAQGGTRGNANGGHLAENIKIGLENAEDKSKNAQRESLRDRLLAELDAENAEKSGKRKVASIDGEAEAKLSVGVGKKNAEIASSLEKNSLGNSAQAGNPGERLSSASLEPEAKETFKDLQENADPTEYSALASQLGTAEVNLFVRVHNTLQEQSAENHL